MLLITVEIGDSVRDQCEAIVSRGLPGDLPGAAAPDRGVLTRATLATE